jgi:hypothetical protein
MRTEAGQRSDDLGSSRHDWNFTLRPPGELSVQATFYTGAFSSKCYYYHQLKQYFFFFFFQYRGLNSGPMP